MKFKKVSIKIQVIILLLFASSSFMANYSRTENLRNIDVRTASIDLSTNMVCGTAKRIIEKALNKVDGIIDIDVDPETKTVAVTYDDTKLNVNKIEKEITNLGYDANDKKGDPDAYQKLPDCCKIK